MRTTMMLAARAGADAAASAAAAAAATGVGVSRRGRSTHTRTSRTPCSCGSTRRRYGDARVLPSMRGNKMDDAPSVEDDYVLQQVDKSGSAARPLGFEICGVFRRTLSCGKRLVAKTARCFSCLWDREVRTSTPTDARQFSRHG